MSFDSGAGPSNEQEQNNRWVNQLTDVLCDKKGEDIKVFPVHSVLADYVVVVSAGSSRHIGALCNAVEEACKKEGIRPISQGKKAPASRRGRRRAPTATQWIVVQAGSVLVHLFSPHEREHYAMDTFLTEQAQTKNSDKEIELV